jgi:hypothetical protein
VADGQDKAARGPARPSPDGVPFLRVVRGDAAPEEIAALVATLTAVAAARTRSADEAKPEPVPTNWNDRARLLRAPVRPAPGAWRRSALPRP